MIGGRVAPEQFTRFSTADGVSVMTRSSAIDVENLRKRYRDGLFGQRRIEALQGVSIAVDRGEIFGLLGPNGAGKTTLIKVLLGIVRRSDGRAQLLGLPAGSQQARRSVGYLPENHRIPRHHTGSSALAFFGALSGLSQREVRAKRPALLEAVGLAEWGQTSVRKYSKGMLQRLGLAQAMLHDPELLILDEPTDGVDPVGRTEMRAILQRLKTEGKTVFINSHLLQEVELVCDRVAILDHGKVLRQGRITELTADRTDADTRLVLLGSEQAIRGAILDSSNVQLQLIAGTANTPPQWEFVYPGGDQPTIDRLVDRLRAAGVSLVSLSRSRLTLEQAFLEILEQARGQ
jgi:ABC-2 type transport system ATP-binding protein